MGERWPETLAIIPARGGSKGVPRKNMRLLGGRPLLAYAVQAARRAASVTRTLVSTDDAEIAAAARQYGAEVLWRPPELSGDTASSEAALLHALEQLERAEGYRPELLVFLQATSPLTLPDDVDGTVRLLLAQRADSALSAAPSHAFLWRVGEDGEASGVNHDRRVRPRRQERAPEYRENGAVYVLRAAGFLAARHRFFGRTVLYVMPAERSVEIDDPLDFAVVEALLAARRREQRRAALPRPVAALALDFDGVFTDNKVVVFQDGREAVVCHRGDGWGLGQLRRRGLPLLVLSTEANPVVAARCAKLGLECRQGLGDKLAELRAWLAARGLPLAGTVYVGNDVNDLDCMRAAGCAVAVADAHPAALAAADIVLEARGGEGAIRELCDLLGEG